MTRDRRLRQERPRQGKGSRTCLRTPAPSEPQKKAQQHAEEKTSHQGEIEREPLTAEDNISRQTTQAYLLPQQPQHAYNQENDPRQDQHLADAHWCPLPVILPSVRSATCPSCCRG